jgi:chlorobactene glucosyltransferase
MTGLMIFVSAALIVISGTTIINVFVLPHLKNRPTTADETPFVSVMIPARNEAAVIGKTIKHLMAQDYPHYEIILLDDQSTDDTGAVAQAAGDTRLRIIRGEALPPGWMGKNWACQQMQKTAQGDILLFTDADVIWQPTALRALVEHMTHTQADLFTIWPTQETQTWAERLTVPLMAMVIIGYLPVIGTHYVRMAAFGAANGQCMAWRHKAYDAVGGHAAVSDNVLEDVTLARMVKSAGLRLRMADGNRLVGCRMYTDWPSVRDGYAKNILAGYGNSIPVLLAATFFHWAVFLLPWVWLATAPMTLWPLLLIVAGLSVRALTAAYTHQRVGDALLLPISVIIMTRIAFQSIYWQIRYGGPVWKGRVIQRKSST